MMRGRTDSLVEVASTTSTKATQAAYMHTISMPSCFSEPTPYFPIVNAIAPKAPSGASFMIRPITPNKLPAAMSSKPISGLALSPNCASETPVRIENSSTCRISPFAKASKIVVGMIFMRPPSVAEAASVPA